jgi:3D (Asp-Asp-Asp) domain-containing protein
MHSADSKPLFTKAQLKLLAGGVAVIAAAGFLQPLTASANVSASLIDSLPNRLVQDFPVKDGAGLVAAASEPRQPLPKQKPKLVYEVVQELGSQVTTAYTSAADETDANGLITASGTRVHKGTVASNRLPFGTKLKIEGFPGVIFTVEDRGGPAFDIDIWMLTKSEAFSWGRRTVKAWIVKPVYR